MIVVDTHVWLWWLIAPEKVSPRALEALPIDDHAISAITMWEIAMLSHRNRIRLDAPPLEWIENAVTRAQTIILPITAAIAVRAGTLESEWIRDPADRMIVASAIHHRVPLVTVDGDIRRSGIVETIW